LSECLVGVGYIGLVADPAETGSVGEYLRSL
jgi:hypothetical protein